MKRFFSIAALIILLAGCTDVNVSSTTSATQKASADAYAKPSVSVTDDDGTCGEMPEDCKDCACENGEWTFSSSKSEADASVAVEQSVDRQFNASSKR